MLLGSLGGFMLPEHFIIHGSSPCMLVSFRRMQFWFVTTSLEKLHVIAKTPPKKRTAPVVDLGHEDANDLPGEHYLLRAVSRFVHDDTRLHCESDWKSSLHSL